MRVDVTSIVAANLVLRDPYAERALLAAILFDQRALDHLADLECDDVGSSYQHIAILQAIRDVQAIGADVSVESVFAELARHRRPHLDCEWQLVDILHSHTATDFAPDELRRLFDRVRSCRARRERFAA